MKYALPAFILSLTMTSGQALAAPQVPPSATDRKDAEAFTPAQQSQIGTIAADYLRAHPEILIEMSQTLQAQEQEKQQKRTLSAVLESQPALLDDPDSPVLNPKGSVAVVQFFDYQCIYCAKVAPVVKKFISLSPDVRYVYKEWPIFGGRWPASAEAAKAGVGIWKVKGANAYYRYHEAIYATGHNEGKLTSDDIRRAAKKAGAEPLVLSELSDAALKANDALAKRLGLQGTPAFIVLPVTGATAENISVLPGAVTLEALQAAVAKARGDVEKGG